MKKTETPKTTRLTSSRKIGQPETKVRVAFYSVLVGLTLTGLKLIVGLLTGSLGILSEAAHSLLDLGAALITLFSVRISSRPPDAKHQYGHGKVENLSALAESLLLLATCLWIVYEAVQRLLGKPAEVEATWVAFLVMGISVILDILISRILYRGARKHSSQALEADALHYSSDILSSSIVIAGLIGVRFGLPILDPIAALGVALLVSIAGIRLIRKTIDGLVDRAPAGLNEKILSEVSEIPEVERVEKIRIRPSGPHTFIDIVVSAKRSYSLDHGYDLTNQIEKKVREIVPQSDIMVKFLPSASGETILDKIRAISDRYPEITEVHNLNAYQDSENGKYFLSLHLKLDPVFSLERAHAIVDRLERDLKNGIPDISGLTTHLEATSDFGDGKQESLSPGEIERLKREILQDPRILGVHAISIHSSSTGNLLSCHILIEESLSLEDAHSVTTSVEDRIKQLLPHIDEVIVHSEPHQP